MREYRTSYAAPCDADRLRKPGYVATRIDIAVRQVPTRTDKAMLRPFSEQGRQSTPPPYLPGLNAGVSRRH